MSYKNTLSDWSKALAEGQVTSEEILKEYFARIRQVDGDINAYLEVNEQGAIERAKELDRERQAGKVRGPFHGLPIAIKDNICVKGLKNTCASKFLEDFVAPYDATVIKKLEEAGAIILGKVNMDEFAMGSATEYSAFGPTKNPWDLDRVPGGSSGGSAAAVASGQAPVALGTDTGGSVRQPAAFNNLVGLKPTYGRVSRYGVTAFASSLDQVGVLARNVADCRLVYETMAGYDPMDSTSLKEEVSQAAGPIQGMKLALPKQFLEGLKDPMRSAFQQAVADFEALGCTVSQIDIKTIPHSLAVYYVLASAEASSNLARFDGIRYGLRAKTQGEEDLYTASRNQGFGEEVKRRIMLGTYVLSAGYYDAYYNAALRVRTAIKAEFEEIFKNYDALICPTTPTLPRKLGERSDNVLDEYLNDLYTVPANIAGLPALAFPAGFAEGLPLSCQLIGNYLEEGKLFDLAQAFESSHDYTSKFSEEAAR